MNTLDPTFSWTSVPGAADYNVYVRRVSDNILVQQKIGVKGTSCSFPNNFAVDVPYYWTVQGRNYKTDKGPMSDKAYFSTEKTEELYTLSVTRLVPNGNGVTVTDSYDRLTWQSSVKLSTPASVEMRDDSGTLQAASVFQRWDVSGTADVNTGAATTSVSNFQSNVTLTTVYADEPPPPVYTLTLILPSDDGTMTDVYYYYSVTATDTQDLFAPMSTYTGDPPYCTDYYLSYWYVSVSVSFEGQYSNMIHLYNFGSDVCVDISGSGVQTPRRPQSAWHEPAYSGGAKPNLAGNAKSASRLFQHALTSVCRYL